MKSLHGVGWIVLLALLGQCGNTVPKEKLSPLPPSTRGAFDAGLSWLERDGGARPFGVEVTILAPVEGVRLEIARSPEVRAKVKMSLPTKIEAAGDYLDKVTYELFSNESRSLVPQVSGPLWGPTANDEWSTRLDLSHLQTGHYTLSITAVTHRGGKGITKVTVLVDAGPTLQIVSPKSMSSYKGSLTVQVQIDPGPFGPINAPIEATIGGSPIILTSLSIPGNYEGLVKFADYNPPLVGEQKLTVAATNAMGTRQKSEVKFYIDVTGPQFLETQPTAGAVVGGVIRVGTKLSDTSGILSQSVTAIIGNQADVHFTLELEPNADSPGFYSALFDTRKLTICKPLPNPGLCIVLPNLSFRASDTLGNESFMAYDFAVDNIPPIYDLDPPELRLMKFDSKARMNVCSWSFDPLGNYQKLGDMPNDQCSVPQVFDLRARIEDQGNHADGLKVVPISGIAPKTVNLFVLDDTAQPLVVDKDGDGVCDDINPLLVLTTSPPKQANEVLAIRLAAVAPKGEGDFFPDPSLASLDVKKFYPECNPGKDLQSPPTLCGAQTIPIAMGYPNALDPHSAIWTIEPLTEKEPWCLGGQFDSHANQISEGWACIAAAGEDRNGNRGVSKPLRVWIQKQGLNQIGLLCPQAPGVAGVPPDCTGTFNPSRNEVTSQACKGRHFLPGELRWQGTATGAP